MVCSWDCFLQFILSCVHTTYCFIDDILFLHSSIQPLHTNKYHQEHVVEGWINKYQWHLLQYFWETYYVDNSWLCNVNGNTCSFQILSYCSTHSSTLINILLIKPVKCACRHVFYSCSHSVKRPIRICILCTKSITSSVHVLQLSTLQH